ncbi:MAG TPA: O-antigen translocase [Salinimicrobium sp.]|nr:O-antigen translocase [Salinimicrobium sp.]
MNAVSIFTRIITGFLVSKALAIFVGPSGMAFVGNLRNFLNSVQSLSTFGIANGIIKFTSEHKRNQAELSKVFSTAFFMIITAALFISIIIFFSAGYWNEKLFQGHEFTNVIKALAMAIPFYAANMILLAVINGNQKYKLYTIINVIANFIGLAVSVFLMWKYNTQGALFALVLVPALTFFITFSLTFKKVKKYFYLISTRYFDSGYLKKFGSFSIMALISALLVPVAYIFVRNYIIDNQTATEAGYWEAMNRISEYYLMFITTLMTLYVLPRFSEIHSNKEFRREVFSFYKTILPILATGMILIFFLKDWIIRLVFSSEFLPMENLFLWQMGGDFLKVASVLLAYQFIAKKMFWHFVLTEIGSMGIFFVLSIFLVEKYGFTGAAMAHFYQYVIYFVVILFIFRKKLLGKDFKEVGRGSPSN